MHTAVATRGISWQKDLRPDSTYRIRGQHQCGQPRKGGHATVDEETKQHAWVLLAQFTISTQISSTVFYCWKILGMYVKVVSEESEENQKWFLSQNKHEKNREERPVYANTSWRKIMPNVTSILLHLHEYNYTRNTHSVISHLWAAVV